MCRSAAEVQPTGDQPQEWAPQRLPAEQQLPPVQEAGQAQGGVTDSCTGGVATTGATGGEASDAA